MNKRSRRTIQMEYSLVRFDDNTGRVQLLLHADKILQLLKNERQPRSVMASQRATSSIEIFSDDEVLFHAEDCNFVVEGVPTRPYSSAFTDFERVESNMRLR
jgi:uncharacterized protein involved in type VI secretion and phage assembly